MTHLSPTPRPHIRTARHAADGVDYEGRTGYGTYVDASLTYDPNGNVKTDGTHNISSVSYNHLNQPVRIDFQGGRTITNSYSGAGRKWRMQCANVDGRTTTHHYIGDAVLVNGKMTQMSFPGGYYDAAGAVHYYITDYQGNVTGVVNESNTVEQEVYYYPDGEPWVEPTGTNRFLFGGKERVTFGGLNSYDFGARFLNSQAVAWWQADPKAEEMPDFSIYVPFSANPVRFIDPTGERPSAYEGVLMCAAVYRDNNCPTHLANLRDLNWKLSDKGKLLQLNHKAGTGIGMQSMLFERTIDGVTEYAYVFAGTDCWEDGVEDILQLIGASPQYQKAMDNGLTVNELVGDAELTFLGHSMGGAQATACAYLTGRDAMTYNPAVLSPFTMIGRSQKGNPTITNYISSTPTQLPVYCDYITLIQNGLGMKAPGTNIPVKLKKMGLSHSIEKMVEALKK